MGQLRDAQMGDEGWDGITRDEERSIWISHVMAQTQANAQHALLAVNWGLYYMLSMDAASQGAFPQGACDSPQKTYDSSTTEARDEGQEPPGANSHEYPDVEDQEPPGANSH